MISPLILILIVISVRAWGVNIPRKEKQLDAAAGPQKVKIISLFAEPLITVLGQISWARQSIGDYNGALEYGRKCLELARKAGAGQQTGAALNLLTVIHLRKGDYALARTCASQVYSISRESGNKNLMAVAQNNIGVSYDYQGNYREALEYYLKALELREEIGDKTLIAASLNNIGVIYKLLGNNREALKYYDRALKIKIELKDERGLANLYINIGNIYSDMKNKDKTLEYYLKSLEIDRKLNNQAGIASTLYNIGLLHNESRNYSQALEYFQQSLAIREKLGEKTSIALPLIDIGNVYQEQRRFLPAVRSIEQGLNLARQSGALDVLQYGCMILSTTYEKMGDFRRALQYYKEYKEAAEKIINSETGKQIAAIQASYEAVKQEKEIEILKKNNDIQKLMLNRQRLIRNVLIAAVAVILLLGVQLIRKYRYIFTFWKKKHYIGHYKILEQMAAGGMGTIYRTTDIMDSHQRTVAVKMLREEYFTDEVQKKRFKQEASIIDQLVHPNIVKVMERGESEGGLYIAMELLEGPTLAEIIQEQKRLPIPMALNIMVQIADAIKSIHAADIIHRDLKPENIVLIKKEDNPYFVKLLDFGLATTQYMSRLTETGMVVGTIFYLSPEQIAGDKLTLASDVHALGVIFYEMLSGVKPFVGETTIDVMKQVMDKEPIHPAKFRSDIDITLCDLVMFMIKKNPASRPNIETIYNILKELEIHYRRSAVRNDLEKEQAL